MNFILPYSRPTGVILLHNYTKVIRNQISFPDFTSPEEVTQYSRWQIAFPLSSHIDSVIFTKPDGTTETVNTFLHQPAELCYDEHGYEIVRAVGETVLCARYTPDTPGTYTYLIMSNSTIKKSGKFSCIKSTYSGYVKISKKDKRYFETDDGKTFCSIGLNLATIKHDSMPKGMEHFEKSDVKMTLGVEEYRRWFELLSSNGGNFARVWLSLGLFDVEKDMYGDFDLAAFAKMDALVEYARKYNIRLKLCIEHFRTLKPGSFASKTFVHPDGTILDNVDEWFTEPKWQTLWQKKISAYMNRYAYEPTIAVWELWNEINTVEASWDIIKTWTQNAIKTLKSLAPKQLVVNSLGSYDCDDAKIAYKDFDSVEMDFMQVHRYLDQGCAYEICHHSPVAFSIDALNQIKREDKPILLAETGAVNDCHTAPFRFYRWDNRGLIFHDTTYPAFFAGAAGSGQIWHWNEYVDTKNLWRYFKPLAEITKNIDFGEESFISEEHSTKDTYFLMLRGQKNILGWIRNKSDTWENAFIFQEQPVAIKEEIFDVGLKEEKARLFNVIGCWEDEGGKLELQNNALKLKNLMHGIVFRIIYH